MDRKSKLKNLAIKIYSWLPRPGDYELDDLELGRASELELTQLIYRIADLHEMFYVTGNPLTREHIVIDWRMLTASLRR